MILLRRNIYFLFSAPRAVIRTPMYCCVYRCSEGLALVVEQMPVTRLCYTRKFACAKTCQAIAAPLSILPLFRERLPRLVLVPPTEQTNYFISFPHPPRTRTSPYSIGVPCPPRPLMDPQHARGSSPELHVWAAHVPGPRRPAGFDPGAADVQLARKVRGGHHKARQGVREARWQRHCFWSFGEQGAVLGYYFNSSARNYFDIRLITR